MITMVVKVKGPGKEDLYLISIYNVLHSTKFKTKKLQHLKYYI